MGYFIVFPETAAIFAYDNGDFYTFFGGILLFSRKTAQFRFSLFLFGKIYTVGFSDLKTGRDEKMNYSDYKSVDGELFERLCVSGAAMLNEHKKEVNDLNVFPIPDGDTGDNMFHTVYGGFGKLKEVSDNDAGKKAEALSAGMLLNARGNSGVILSQLFFGIGKGLSGHKTATVQNVGDAFNEGVKSAYLAVVTPVEGTILTVARESVEYARSRITENSTLLSFFEDMLCEMKESLQRTPDLLPVLKEAGVIDSGGAGLYYVISGMKEAVTGNGLSLTEDGNVTVKDADFSLFTENDVMKYGYCTEFLLQLQTCKTDVNAFDVKTVIDYLETIGDSIVAFKTGTIVKVHVHTLTPYKALEFCQRYGEFLTVKIENMTLQHNETIKDRSEESAFSAVEKPRKKFGVCVVASGDGIIKMFKDMGVDYVIEGGQTCNPSGEDFINAFKEICADDIYVFPNNGNVILTAKQAGDLFTESKIHVIESKNIGDCYAALSMADFEGEAEDVTAALKANMQFVKTGMVSIAVRDAKLSGVEIKTGEYIGFTEKAVKTCKKDKLSAAKSLCEEMGIKEKEFLIAVFGKSITEAEKTEFSEYVKGYGNVEYYPMDGGQDVYDLILIFQ